MLNKFFGFINSSPTAYHTVANIAAELDKNGFNRIREGERLCPEKNDRFYVIRNGSSIVAVDYRGESAPLMICAAHSDSPTFKVKEERGGIYTTLATEKYGGMILYSWFDRPLSVAGRAAVRCGDSIEMRLVNIDRDLLVIPSVAIHQNRSVNDGFSPNPAIDLLPLFSIEKGKSFSALLSEELGVKEEDIISHDLCLYVRDGARLVGADSELILSPRLDDLECVFAAMTAFLDKSEGVGEATRVLAVFDNEEVGSETKQGAASGFLLDILTRAVGSSERLSMLLESSFMVSADNAHARHPAHPELSDPTDAPRLGGGITVKLNANQRYATDAVSSAVFTEICRRVGVKTERYTNRADLPGGSTLGSISNTVLSLSTVDIGLPQLAMHSSVETAAVSDLCDLVKALSELYRSSLEVCGEKIVIKA